LADASSPAISREWATRPRKVFDRPILGVLAILARKLLLDALGVPLV